MDFSNLNFFLISVILLTSYILGGINFSIIISKFVGQKKDIRALGSNNAGFSNALRSLGVAPAVFVFIGDFFKGVLSVFLSKLFCEKCGFSGDEGILLLAVSGLFCCLGHIWPCFFKGKGGKGILTTWSCSLLIDWKVFICLILIFIIVLISFKIISLASIISAISYPILYFFFTQDYTQEIHVSVTLISLILASVVLFSHRSNIKRIFLGQEKKITIHKN